jgi:hypothetical protein
MVKRLVATISLVLALMTAILWARSWGKPLHFTREAKISIDTNREFHGDFQFHSLDAGYLSIGYASAIVDESRPRAELARMRKNNPHMIFDVYFGGDWRWHWLQREIAPPKQTKAGFSFDHGFSKTNDPRLANINGKWIRLTLPHWFLILLLSIPGITHTATQTKRRFRLRRGLCPICGYDLCESKSTCPECGAPNAPASSAS